MPEIQKRLMENLDPKMGPTINPHHRSKNLSGKTGPSYHREIAPIF